MPDHRNGRPWSDNLGAANVSDLTDLDTTRVAPAAHSVTSSVTPSVSKTLTTAACCSRATLIVTDGRKVCSKHAAADEVALVHDLNGRADLLGLPEPRSWDRWHEPARWPYGPRLYLSMRRALVEWAEGNQLAYAENVQHACLPWLERGRQCWAGRCVEKRRGEPAVATWRDHVSAWTRDGLPACLVAHPYVLTGADVDELSGLDQDPRFSVTVTEPEPGGWYGAGTYAVEVHNATRLTRLPMRGAA